MGFSQLLKKKKKLLKLLKKIIREVLIIVFSSCDRKLCPTYSSVDNNIESTFNEDKFTKKVVSL